MSRLEWDKSGERLYETGVDQGVLYPMVSGAYPTGVAWNGLTAVNENPSGGDSTAIYADNIKYLTLVSAEEFGATVEAYTYPDEFAECDGSAEIGTGVTIGQQRRKTFGMSYRTLIGNDEEDTDYGYKIHLVYGCKAAPSGRNHQTVNNSPEATSLSWEVTTTPVTIVDATTGTPYVDATTGKPYKPTSHLVIDSTKVAAAKLTALETILYGGTGENATARMPLPGEVIALLNSN